MGGCTSQPATGRRASDIIDSSLKAAQRDYFSVIRLLLLGTGESGKSTIFKQVKIIHDAGFNPEERRGQVPLVHGNIVLNMQALINACSPENLNLPLSETYHDDVEAIQALTVQGNELVVDLETASRIENLWFSKEIQAAYKERSRFYVGDSAQYFFDALDRISASGYEPTDEDILHARVRTTGIVRRTFQTMGVTFELIDVGGQRTDRRKWIHCFEDVHAVMFVASLADYDGVLVEDGVTNRMVEALDVFGDICQSRFFADSSFILFLNKTDLFETKIKTTNITVAFPEYTGPQAFGPASEYIKDAFMGVARMAGVSSRLYTHFTCATNTSTISTVLSSVNDMMLTQNLQNSGFV